MALSITSTKNQRILAAARLRAGKTRRSTGRFLIDGYREIARARDSSVELLEVFACENLCSKTQLELLSELETSGVTSVYSVPEPVFERVAYGDRRDGLVAVAATPSCALTDLKLPARPLVLVLEAIEKPGNVGAVLRSADAAGFDAVLVCDPISDLFNPNTIRASLGAIFTMPVLTTTSEQAQAWLREHDICVYTARVDGECAYSRGRFDEGSAIVLGAESEGLSDKWCDTDFHSIALPMQGQVDSLNISTAAAVLMYEARRQRLSKS